MLAKFQERFLIFFLSYDLPLPLTTSLFWSFLMCSNKSETSEQVNEIVQTMKVIRLKPLFEYYFHIGVFAILEQRNPSRKIVIFFMQQLQQHNEILLEETKFCNFCLNFQTFRRFCETKRPFRMHIFALDYTRMIWKKWQCFVVTSLF